MEIIQCRRRIQALWKWSFSKFRHSKVWGSYNETKYSFDRICEDSSNGKPWGDDKRHFSSFNNATTTPLGIDKDTNRYAMRNAGLRVWVLMADYNNDGKLLEIAENNNCIDTEGSCFRDLYKGDPYYIKDSKCEAACMGASDDTCYQCLKTYYSQPICSRDNFAVRPYGIELTAKSNNVDIQRNNTVASFIANLISGLRDDYTVSMTAKSANSEPDPMGYYFRRITSEATNILNSLFSSMDEFFGLKFDETKTKSSDITLCADSTHKRFNPTMAAWTLVNDNVGNYDIELIDKNWTIVDQARFGANKAKVSQGSDDCIPNSTVYDPAGKDGCDVQSFDVNNDPTFNKIPVKFVPNKIDIQNIAYDSVPVHGSKWAYMNRLDEDPDMGVQFAGTVTAKNANGAITSNFTAGCFAQDVNILNQYSTTQIDSNGNVRLENTDSTPIKNGDSINFRYAATYDNNTSFFNGTPITLMGTTMTDEKNQDFINQNTITRSRFSNHAAVDSALDGSLVMDLRYNIYKLYYVAVNPISVLFVGLSSQLLNDDGTPVYAWQNGFGPTADLKTAKSGTAIADIKALFARNSAAYPDLAADIVANSFKFLYGRVFTPLEARFAKEVKDSKNVWFTAMIFNNNSSSLDTLKGVLGENITQPLTNWYTVRTHSIDEKDGRIISLRDLNGGSTISPNSNILFDSNEPSASGVTKAVKVAYPRPQARPYLAHIEVNPDIWLKYHTTKASGNPEFKISFEDIGYNWAGKGQTGNIVNQPSSPNAQKRLNW